MARPLAQCRFTHITRQERKQIGWTKPMLVSALQDMPTLCPPRVRQQSKAYHQGIVERALWNSSDDIAARMRSAMADARKAVA